MSSSDGDSWPSVEITGASIRARDGGDDAATLSSSKAEGFLSSYQSQESVDTVCKKYGISSEFAALPAGRRRACWMPPRGSVCVLAHALEAGMRVPLHPFFCEVLNHFGIAPSQLVPNGWRVMVGFIVLSHFAGVPPSLTVFRHHFLLSKGALKGWYYFQRRAVRVLFKGLPNVIDGWKQEFFFLSSKTPWPCPVVWGMPSKSSIAKPVLTHEENETAAKLLRARGAAVLDLQTYICDDNLAAAMIITRAASAPPQPPLRPTYVLGADASSMRVEKAAAAHSVAAKLKTEPNNDKPGRPPSSEKKRKLDKNNVEELLHGDTANWEEAQALLHDIVTPSRKSKFMAAKPSEVVGSSYVAMLQAANYAAYSFNHALELEKELGARKDETAAVQEELKNAKAEIASLQEELKNVKAELAGARAVAADVESARAAAVQEYLASEEHERRLAEHALEVYKNSIERIQRACSTSGASTPAHARPPGGP